MATILSIETAALFQAALAAAAERLIAGDVVVTPTETVYGLAADAFNPAAVAKIFEIKGRPSTNPIIVHVATLSQARQCASEWTQHAATLASAFWPGALTLVLPRSKAVPDIVTGGGPTVAIRWPSHPFMRALIERCGFPIAAPSANLSTQVSATAAEHAAKSLGERVALIIDAGPAAVGIESTVVDVSRDGPPRILRPGMISRAEISRVLGAPIEVHSETAPSENPAPSPGLMTRHYSPQATLAVRSWRSDFPALLDEFALSESRRAHVIAHTNIPQEGAFHSVSLVPLDAEAYARALYAELHRADESGAAVIIVEALPDAPEWEALNDRLRRASASA